MSDQTPLSEELLVWLSAYVDGVLNEAERAEVDALVARDPQVAAELEALFALDDDIRGAFDGLLDEPAPMPDVLSSRPAPANTNRAPWRAMAAMLVLGAVLGAGGMWAVRATPEPVQIAAKRSWLGEVAEYHQIYARQTRHLVEVGADEKAHIEKWLGKEIGVAFTVPDLSPAGWTFQGARLLVAAGKPVAQLMYTDANGRVIALCALQNGSGAPADTALKQFGDVHMATWKSSAGSFAIVGETPSELEALAVIAQPLI
ncbi:anti-sigma factor family protein [Planktotalea sp.]|uniref:anti-sigma factor family protein n=1 Tax=Planktotalea sp. TaxID=2029877 RepID=UPI003D6C0A5E